MNKNKIEKFLGIYHGILFYIVSIYTFAFISNHDCDFEIISLYKH